MSDLTDKQEAFCREYLVDLNATQAAIRAGYSRESAYSIASDNLRKPDIRARIGEMMDERSKRTLVDQDWVVRQLQKVYNQCIKPEPVMEFNGESMEQKRDEEGNLVWEFDSTGANKSLELLGKHLKMFTDKVDHTLNDFDVTLNLDGIQNKVHAPVPVQLPASDTGQPGEVHGNGGVNQNG